MTRKNQFEPVSTTRKNQFVLVTASFYDKKKPVWPNHSKCHQPGRNSLSKSELVSTTRNNQFELVTASINHLHLLCTTTSNKQFELVTASLNNQEELDLDSHSYFQPQGKTGLSQFQQPGRTSFELVTTSFNDKQKTQFGLVTASLNNQEEPVSATRS